PARHRELDVRRVAHRLAVDVHAPPRNRVDGQQGRLRGWWRWPRDARRRRGDRRGGAPVHWWSFERRGLRPARRLTLGLGLWWLDGALGRRRRRRLALGGGHG